MRFCLLLASLLCSTCVGWAAEPALKVAGALWCPYNCAADPQAKRPGFMLEILDAALAQQGRKMRYQEYPWRRAIVATRNLQTDLIAGTLKSDAPDFVFGQQAFGVSRSCFVTRADSQWHYHSVADLTRLRLAVNNDQTFGEPVDSHVRSARNRSYIFLGGGSDYLHKHLEALARGQIDLTLEDEYVLNDWFKQSGRSAEFRFAGCLHSGPVYVSVSPQHPQAKALVRMLDRGVRALRESGELARILAKYGIRDWQN
ncbi:substrate-binding periplasmic protein [Chitinimonas taiwanensis]|uniref:Polar amino acid transport system substrate-binding protein n=1 Tax=Chitinimonas taiwanensis DSM 18899 TaxID=1121279 RepID=A0A1K2H9G7_9NEIS|nr:transporter substrate-binding domain-containing protein [Chitinimonas taiwanensis]SFZ73379.1 polar amino acid transport system substrate-binding protein [Chitinimonas taiwanensis DSM 18899]